MINRQRRLFISGICAILFSSVSTGFAMEPAAKSVVETARAEDSIHDRPDEATVSLDYIMSDAYLEELKSRGDLDFIELLTAASAGDVDKVGSLMKRKNYSPSELSLAMTRVVTLKRFDAMKAMIEIDKTLTFDACCEASMIGYIEAVLYCKSQGLSDWEKMALLVEVCASDRIKEEDRIACLPHLKRDVPPRRIWMAAKFLVGRGCPERLRYLNRHNYI